MDLINQDQNNLNSRACNAFMLLTVSVAVYDGIAKLSEAAERAEKEAGADDTGARMYINALGAHHGELKIVMGKFKKVRTYLYQVTLSFSQAEEGMQKRGKRIAPVVRIPEILNHLNILKNEAYAALDDLLPQWDHLCNIAQSRSGRFGDEVKYPSAYEVREKFKICISIPECINPVDMDRFGSLPVSLANDIAKASNDKLTSQLESAKTEAMKAAKGHMDVVIKQLSEGKRLSETLVSLSALHSKMLRDLVNGYDNDPRIIAMADRIDNEIASQSVDRWKQSDYARTKSIDAAKVVSKGLGAMVQPVSPDQIQSTNQSLAGGLLADLID